ncbi:MAG: hypothetical protein PHN45_07430 [Methylococcales bacterium]|nr:hypothetical protein [Methylococcales bacterium]
MGEAKKRGTFEDRKKAAFEKAKKTTDGKVFSMNDMLDIFAPTTEAMTDELYQELLSKGIPEKDWNELKNLGFRYNRARDSFSAPSDFLD